MPVAADPSPLGWAAIVAFMLSGVPLALAISYVGHAVMDRRRRSQDR